jgi:hypothetical protein
MTIPMENKIVGIELNHKSRPIEIGEAVSANANQTQK